MILKYQSNHLSITKFDSVEIPDFTVLTGVNGSGKSHLLAAIVNKRVLTEGIVNPRIVHFNYETFRLENEGQNNALQISGERAAAWKLFQEPKNTNIKATIENFKNNLGPVYAELTELCTQHEKSLWDLNRKDVGNDDVFEQLQTYRQNVRDHFQNNRHLQNNLQASAMLVMAKKLGFSLDEIPEHEFHNRFEPYSLKSDFLPTQLGKTFMDYFSKYELNQYNEFRNTHSGEKHDVLTDDEFFEFYGPKPWNIVNEILQTFSSLPYKINSPEGLNRDDNYQAKLIHTGKTDVFPVFSELSSGERILMALVASIFKSSSDSHFPDVLLLDEIDASLHPSMMQNLLDVIQNVFLQNGVKVLLVTHSPTTIALAPDESIYVMNKEGEQRIEKKSKSDALDILTEGFATLEKGLQLLDEIASTDMAIITEGRNIAFIEKALKFGGIEGVEIIKGAEDRTGKTQLKTLYDFFSILPHDRAVLIVWDCDVRSYNSLEIVNNTVPFVFAPNEKNTICKKGIENLFAEELFNDFKKTITMSDGSATVEFDSGRKVDFEKLVMSRNFKSDFDLFQPLIDKIVSIRNAA